MGRYLFKKDNNQNEIVKKLQAEGLAVVDLSAVGNGVPDLLISDSSTMWLAEIKSEYGKLTPIQQKYHLNWTGKPIIIAYSFDELMKKIKTP